MLLVDLLLEIYLDIFNAEFIYIYASVIMSRWEIKTVRQIHVADMPSKLSRPVEKIQCLLPR